jgi:hypothetical protein
MITDADLAGLADRARAATQEPWQWGHSGTKTHEDAVRYMTDSLMRSDQTDVHMVFIGDADAPGATRVVCYTGNGPTSEANAAYLACLEPKNIIALCDELRNARHRIKHLMRKAD